MTGPDISGRSDRELVLAFQAGNEAAFDELYDRHHDRVARVCFRYMNNRPDAEEAAQEAFLKAFQALPRFNGQYQVGAWLSRIAANVCVDNLRVEEPDPPRLSPQLTTGTRSPKRGRRPY